jgi:hypothetical protein
MLRLALARGRACAAQRGVAGSIVFRRCRVWVLPLAAIPLGAMLLAGCGTVDRIRGKKEGASDDVAAAKLKAEDPLARPIQVAWTSARASYCAFIFDPAKLRSDYLATEASLGKSPAELQKIQQAYDYTLKSVADSIKDDPNYCTKARVDAVRSALNRYLAGDYSPGARIAQ